jgi:tRNA G18 (ribose-2'-O)-methylase SpoU
VEAGFSQLVFKLCYGGSLPREPAVPIVPIDDLSDPRLADYRNVPDSELLRHRGAFVAEGRIVVRHLLDSRRFTTRSVLVSPQALEGLHEALDGHRDLPVFVIPPEAISALVGFNMHRGCLALGERPAPPPVGAWLAATGGTRLVVAIEGVANADNVGGIFRNALAFGAGGVLLSPTSCDPLYRKATRVSTGATLRLPFTYATNWPGDLQSLKKAGYHIFALTPDNGARDVEEALTMRPHDTRLALLLGHEGTGLTDAALLAADDCVRIAMAPGVDSLNVASAAGVALYACTRRRASGRLSVW